ncbi:hypothetical protein FVE85_6889 [Porphyridium purpureum]|uniref:Uncharacterized protein n=1 Tax=Porphyridium purpureum TaxID=35688 RepID=A0A5J4Z8J7_PORPP|nr:hypothetical protein FVE85_6889 [Porphyridium purpureum]|eukprot:POR5172..scf295_1
MNSTGTTLYGHEGDAGISSLSMLCIAPDLIRKHMQRRSRYRARRVYQSTYRWRSLEQNDPKIILEWFKYKSKRLPDSDDRLGTPAIGIHRLIIL